MLAAVITCEIISTGLIVYGIMHEEKLVAFEDRIIHWLCVRIKDIINNLIRRLYLKGRRMKRFCKAVKVSICTKALEKEGITINKKGA